MDGTIVLNHTAGRVLRRAGGNVCVRDVLDCGGGFGVGDTVYLTFRAVDGGQYMIATGVVACAENVLKQMLGAPTETVIVREHELKLLW